MLWKIWTLNSQALEASGIYLLNNVANAERYLKMHRARLESFGVKNRHGKIFEVNASLSAINQVDFEIRSFFLNHSSRLKKKKGILLNDESKKQFNKF